MKAAPYRTLVEHAPDLVYQVTCSEDDWTVGQLVCAGPPAEGVSRPGGPRSEPRLWFHDVHPADRPELDAATRRILASRHAGLREYRVRSSETDPYRWIEDRIMPLVDGANRITGYVGVARDVTPRKNRERELQAAADLSHVLRSAKSRTELPAVLLDATMRLLTAGASALAIRDGRTGDILIERGDGRFAPATGLRLQPGSLTGRVIEAAEAFVSNDPQSELTFQMRHLVGDLGAVACAPLVADGLAIGALWVARIDPIEEAERHLLEVVADVAAAALVRAAHHAEALRHARALQAAYDATIVGWAQALELRDAETAGHTRRVADLTVALARRTGTWTDRELRDLRWGALLHDIGKMAVPDAILLKPGRLTPEEVDTMQQHADHARRMLADIPYLEGALDIPYCHHERWDGSGYPRGLQGTDIPIAARIFAVVDVFDALTSDRPYRPALPDTDVLAYLEAQAGVLFDPAVVRAFLDLRRGL